MQSCLICDDHALMRDALATAIAARWPNARIALADSFDTAWQSAATDTPDLCLVDLIMPGAAPLAGVTRLMQIASDARTIVVTGTHDDNLLLDLLDAGVHGFLQKTSSSAVFIAAIGLVMAGGRYLPPRVAELAIAPATTVPEADPGIRPPTDRQRQVLTLIAKGQSNKEIARQLGVSPATIKTHVASAIAAVGAANRTEAAIRARELRLI